MDETNSNFNTTLVRFKHHQDVNGGHRDHQFQYYISSIQTGALSALFLLVEDEFNPFRRE